MQIGVMGLGRMGANIARRLMRHGHACVVYDRDPEPGRALAAEGAAAAAELGELVKALGAPRVVWVMLPAGAATEAAIAELGRLLAAGDTVIDGGNTFWKDDIRRAGELKAHGLHYLDVGTSGGVWGLERGYCLMIGGEKAVVERLDPIFAALAPGKGDHSRHRRPRGAGRARRAGLSARGAQRRRPFRQDDPQRHRVRHDAGDGRGLRHLAQRRLAARARGAAPRHRCRRRGRGVAPRQRHHLLAARPDGGGAGRGRRRSPAIRATWRIQARDAGPCRRPSRRRCRPRC